MSDRKKAFDDLLGIGKKTKNVCSKENCDYCKESRTDKRCSENHPTGVYEFCEFNSHPEYRVKPPS